jgi:hypothetical protein
VWNPLCGAPKTCFNTDPKTKRRTVEAAFATLIQQSGKWVLASVWCPATSDPVPTTQALRQQVLRLLPAVRIGSAWDTRALVNAQSIFWAVTDPDRALPTATVVGRRVQLRIHFDHATWNFGDGATDSTTDPGKPYTEADSCNTAQCPGYYGHTYTDTGSVTISLSVSWHAQFSLDGGTTWTDVDQAPLTGPTTTHQLSVVQARGVLVPDPGSR